MPFYEVVYETGRFSVAEYQDDDEAYAALTAAHARAKAGLAGGPAGHNAERVSAVFKYDKHPGEYNPEATMSAEVAGKALQDVIKASTKQGVVQLNEVAAGVRNLTNPLKQSAPHESNYKLEPVATLKPAKWGGDNN